MTLRCLVCNSQGPLGKNHVTNVFDENNTLSSERRLLDTLCEIIGTQLEEENVHTKILCKECLRICNSYDMSRTNMSILKMKLSDLYQASQKVLIADMAALAPIKEVPKSITTKGKFVVPASKLQPLPADYQLNLGKIAAMASNKGPVQKPLLNLKMTIGNSLLTQNLASSVKLVEPASAISLGDWNVDGLPTEIFSSGHEGEGNDEGNADDENPNVEEECDVTPASKSDPLLIEAPSIKTENTGGTRYINSEDFELLIDGQQQGDEPHTIVVDSNSSILQMMSGQKLVYENGQLSLVNDDDDDEDGQESNDEESQIELQVSGDEETANAIIAAAQEQGGAIIKVESGEMYRVKSVQSTPAETITSDTATQLVAKEGSIFRCLVCDNQRDTIKTSYTGDACSMVKHMKDQHSAKVYICAHCGIIMRNRSEYTSHIAKHTKKLSQTSKVKTYDCDVCKKSYNSRTLVQEHMNLHTGKRPYACHICGKAFASKYTRQAHLKTHEERPRPFKCATCSKSFLSQQNLTQHEKTHVGVKNFICNICNKAFGTQHSLEVHGVVHSGQRPHRCTVCEKAFARRAELTDHARIHTGERPFECELCGARFSQRSNLHSHRRATHFDDKRHTCPDCPKRFKRKRLLQYHIKAAHTGERPLQCNVCRATFVYPEHYKKHARIHSGVRPYYCEICGKAFNSRDNRNTHRFVHSDKKPYECLACGASYMRKRMLVAHMNSNGHLAESIVVNQPRVTKVNETIMIEKTPKKSETPLFEDEDKDIEDKLEKEEQENEKMYTLTEGVEEVVADNVALPLIAVNSDVLEPQQMTDDNGSIIRFIQVKMPDGQDGWVAFND